MASTGKKLIEARDLTKKFDGVTAVDNISFDLYRGEILGLLGPNGAGKTTTLQMLLDLTTPTSGRITLFDGLCFRNNREEILNRVNFSSAYISLPYSLTVRENLTVFAGLYGIRKPAKKIVELLDLFEIGSICNIDVRKLSSGQVTRVCMVKALLNDPEILFLDEPTASLDPDMADKTRRLLKRVRDEKKTSMVYTSHNMKEMEELSDRLIFLNKGRIIAQGTPSEILISLKGKDLEELFIKIARGSV